METVANIGRRGARRRSAALASPTAIPMKIADWMQVRVHTVRPHDSVAHARAILEEFRINQLPVVARDKLVGIVTDRDLRSALQEVRISAAAAGTRDDQLPSGPNEISVEDVMSEAVLTLAPFNTLSSAAELMRQKRIGALPVVDKRRLVGIIARSDILDAFVSIVTKKGMRPSR